MAERETLPVIFRLESYGRGDWRPVAIFPTLPGDVGQSASCACYTHLGQHSSRSYRFYIGTRKASPEQYADLLAELRGIYEDADDPDAVTLVPVLRWTKFHDAERMKEYR